MAVSAAIPTYAHGNWRRGRLLLMVGASLKRSGRPECGRALGSSRGGRGVWPAWPTITACGMADGWLVVWVSASSLKAPLRPSDAAGAADTARTGARATAPGETPGASLTTPCWVTRRPVLWLGGGVATWDAPPVP